MFGNSVIYKMMSLQKKSLGLTRNKEVPAPSKESCWIVYFQGADLVANCEIKANCFPFPVFVLSEANQMLVKSTFLPAK